MKKNFKRNYPAHWRQHFISGVSSFNAEEYKLEIIELYKNENAEFNLLYIPGYTQNAYSFDLLPDQGISISKWVDNQYRCDQFVLHPNGIGYSDYLKGSTADEIAGDDIRLAVEYLKSLTDKPLYVFGHSNGTISLKAHLSGLTKGGFNKSEAKLRQSKIEGAIFSAGNVAMSFSHWFTYLHFLGALGHLLYPFLVFWGWINLHFGIKCFERVNKKLGSFNLGTLRLWNFLYLVRNVSKEAQLAIYHKSVDGVSSHSLWQYSRSLFERSMKSKSGEYFLDHLENIELPVVQVTYQFDTLAQPQKTFQDDFSRIRSNKRLFLEFEDQGHEDFMMNVVYHDQFKQVFDQLLKAD